MPQSALRHHQGSPELAPSPIHSSQSPTSSQQPVAQRTNGASAERKISCEDIQLVQNLIERCLLLYMNRKDVVQTLQQQAKVEPGFTSLVWTKLEEQNPDFFKAYYTRLKLKMHIATFNHLIEQQAELMRKMGLLPSPVYHHPPVPVSQTMPTHSTSASPRQTQEGTEHSSMQSEAEAELHTSPDTLYFGTTPTEIQGMNLESNFVHHDSQSLDSLSTDADAMNSRDSLSTLGHLPRNFSLSDLTADLGPLGPHSKFPRNFSLSDLTADLGPDLGGLGSYSSPFVNSDAEAYLGSPELISEEQVLEFTDCK